MPQYPSINERIAAMGQAQVLPDLLAYSARIRGDVDAFCQYDSTTKTWIHLKYAELAARVERWKKAFAAEHLDRGSRVAMLLPNCIDAICFDMAAISCSLVPVPLHAIDTPGSSGFILNDSGAKMLFTNKRARSNAIETAMGMLPDLRRIVLTDDDAERAEGIPVISLAHWLEEGEKAGAQLPAGPQSDDLAALVYTSGTTGRPKGVMLTHRAILADCTGVLQMLHPNDEETWFSFLPLSHTLERTTSYYIAVGLGHTVWFNRNIMQIAEDFMVVRPTVMISVPRIYEKVYSTVQATLRKKGDFAQKIMDWAVEVGWRRHCRMNGLPVEHTWREFLDPFVGGILDRLAGKPIRDRFGDRMHVLVSGGAALSQPIARFFLGLRFPIVQGFGMTECCPVAAVNSLEENHPATVGRCLPNIEVRLGENDELQIRGPIVMRGYWKRPEDTAKTVVDGWLRTGDQASIDENGFIQIKGRIKEIIVTSSGEKIPPADVEMAIETDPLFEQAMLVGEGKPFVTALAVVNAAEWRQLAKSLNLDPKDPASLADKRVRLQAMRRIKQRAASFPQYGVPRAVTLLTDPWTIENGCLTPTLKLKRRVILKNCAPAISEMYSGRRS